MDLTKYHKTCVCKLGEDCTDKKNCTYAHSPEELRPRMCKYRKKCSVKTCEFYHDNSEIPSQKEMFEELVEKMKFTNCNQTKFFMF